MARLNFAEAAKTATTLGADVFALPTNERRAQAMTAIIKPLKPVDVDQRILAMWLMSCSAPKKAEPEPDGSYSLGEIGDVGLQEQRLLRDTPYSTCRGLRDSALRQA